MIASLLNELISIKTLHDKPFENQRMIDLLCKLLASLGFSSSVKGAERSNQPVLVARRPANLSSKKIVIYGHYDVAQVNTDERWVSRDPFDLIQLEGRLYARGIADNKGALFARLMAIKSIVDSKARCPEILWLIQGEEEIEHDERIALDIFKNEIDQFKCNVFVEETGFNDISSEQQIAFLWSKSVALPELTSYSALLNCALDNPRIEFRHLNKLTGEANCPLLKNLPDEAVYIGFGPNDKLHNIHRANESLNLRLLNQHVVQFERFLSLFASCKLTGVDGVMP